MKTKMQEPEIITRKGKAVSVILPIKAYQEMLGRLEDADDIEWLKKARKKPPSFRILDDALADLKI
ncbi:MAG: type II toxin-antitoxin system Phd/YefM family antitoxin [Luteolibacter sp.]